MLVGSELAGLHPEVLEKSGDIRVMKSQFGHGYLLNGRHQGIKVEDVAWAENISAIREGKFKIRSTSYSVNRQAIITPQQRNFLDGEELGVYCPKRCNKCKNCSDCLYSNKMLSEQEQFEYNLIEQGVEYEEGRGVFKIQYPFLQDPQEALTDNWGQAVTMASSLEKRLKREGFVEEFNAEFKKMRDKGAIIELSQAEIDQWDGAVHYIPLQLVHNPSSASTPFRVVTNSSCPDPVTRESLNSIMAKGPNCLSDQWEVLARFRNYEVPLTSDVTKAYYSMETGLVEMHLRRVIWRDCETDEPWKIYAYVVVSFGDRPAAVLLEICIRKTVDLFGTIDPEAALKILKDRFVDDLASGGNRSQVERYMGNEDEETLQCDGTMPSILRKGGLTLKVMVPGGETNAAKREKLGNAVLGIPYDAENDRMHIVFTVNVGKKKRGVKIEADLTVDTMDSKLVAAKLSPRILLGIINSQYDPLGLISPITVRLKKQFQEVHSPEYKLKWDDEILGELRQEWVKLIEMLVVAGKITFQRATKPANTVGDPDLIIYWDGSNAAAAGVIYIRWILKGGGYSVHLVASKSRITPLGPISTVRVEMNSATLCTRLVKTVVEALSIPIGRIWSVGDSNVVLASREKNSAPFSEYFANRIGEQKETQQDLENQGYVIGEWYHVASSGNAADAPSRLDTTPDMIGEGSSWQCGPDYLYLPREKWPLDRKFADQKTAVGIPKEELRKKYREIPDQKISAIDAQTPVSFSPTSQPPVSFSPIAQVPVSSGPIAQMADNWVAEALGWGFNTNEWSALISKTAVFYRPFLEFRKKKFLEKGFLTEENLSVLAEYNISKPADFWLRIATSATREAVKAGKLKEFELKERNGLLVLGTRANLAVKHHYGKDSLPVIMSSTRVAELVMMDAHSKDHKSVAITVANSRKTCFIVGARKLAKTIVKSCVKCRVVAKKLQAQKMGSLPERLQVPAPCFTNISVDLAGSEKCGSVFMFA